MPWSKPDRSDGNNYREDEHVNNQYLITSASPPNSTAIADNLQQSQGYNSPLTVPSSATSRGSKGDNRRSIVLDPYSPLSFNIGGSSSNGSSPAGSEAPLIYSCSSSFQSGVLEVPKNNRMETTPQLYIGRSPVPNVVTHLEVNERHLIVSSPQFNNYEEYRGNASPSPSTVMPDPGK